LSQTKHWRDWRNVLCILLIGLSTNGAWAQGKAVGPARFSLSPASPQPIPNGKSLKLAVLKSFFRNSSQTTNVRDVSSRVAWSSSDPTTISVSSHGLAIAHQPSGTVTITATIKGIGTPTQLTMMLTAAPAVLSFISINNFNSSVTVTGTLAYTATQHYSDGTTPPFPSPVTWGVVNNVAGSGQATIISTGNATGTATGTVAGVVKVTATFDPGTGPVTGATYLNVGLTAISISPLSPPATPPSVPKGDLQTFSALGTFGAGSLNVTSYVRWSSATGSVAGITSASASCTSLCTTGGIASTHATGTTDITAISGLITSNVVTLTVTPAVVASIVISPSTCTPSNVPRGNSCQFTALAFYSDQTTSSLPSTGSWNSTNAGCAAIDPSTGLATTLSSVPNPCNTNITATYTNTNPPNNLVTSNLIVLTVTAHVLKSISVSPATPTQPKGTFQQFTVRAHYTDGTVTVPNSGAGSPVWASSNTSVATIGSTSGLASTTNSAIGTTNIGATYNGFQAFTVFTVTSAALNSITVTAVSPVPTNPPSSNTTIPIAGTQQFQAIGNYSDNTHPDITSFVNWSSTDATVATINDPNSPGEATGVTAGTVTITATDPTSGKAGSASPPLTVITVSSISVNPPSANISPGSQQQFSATANYGGTTQLLTAFGPAWSSNHVNVATVDQNGLATAVSGGSATITATLGSVSCPSGGGNCGALTVNPAVLQSITVSCDPNNPCTGSGEPLLSLGQTEQMVATGNYSDGSSQDLTQDTHLTWGSSSGSVATIDTTGFLTTKGLGSTNITAMCSSLCPGATSTVTGTLPLTVTF